MPRSKDLLLMDSERDISVKKRIRIVIGTLEVGGAEIHLSHVLPQLAARGWQIQLIVLSDKVALRDFFLHEKIELLTVPVAATPFLFLRRALRFVKCIRLLRGLYNQDPHRLTHFFLPNSYIVGRLVGFLTKAKGPWVMSRRSLRLYQQKIWGCALLERLLHKRCDAILVNSRRVGEELITKEGVEARKIKLIYNGLSFHEASSSPDVAQELRISPGTTILIHVANFIPYKGHLDLFKALGIMKDQGCINWVLLLVGKGPAYETVLRNAAKEARIEENIRWITKCSHPLPYLKQSHIGVLPSHQEGFSNALLEKMAASLPVVATDVGGNGEAIVEGETGILIPSHDENALAHALLRLVQDPYLRETMGKKGKLRFEQNFSLRQCVEAYEAFYKEIIGVT